MAVIVKFLELNYLLLNASSEQLESIDLRKMIVLRTDGPKHQADYHDDLNKKKLSKVSPKSNFLCQKNECSQKYSIL